MFIRISVATTDCDEDAMQNDVILTRDIDDKVIETSMKFSFVLMQAS